MKVGDRLEEMTAGTDKEEAEQLALAAPKSSVLPGRPANSQSYRCLGTSREYSK